MHDQSMRPHMNRTQQIKVIVSSNDYILNIQWFIPFLIVVVNLIFSGCEDEQPSFDDIQPINQPPVSGESEQPIADPIPPVPSAGADTPVAGTTNSSCVTCGDTCPDIMCDCPDRTPLRFSGCQNECCLSADEACDDLCAALPPPECRYGEVRCLEGTPSAINRCNREQIWEVDSCPVDTECNFDTCISISCDDGERFCSDNQPVTCQGGVWTAQSPCEGNCYNGECLSPECANAAASNSYLGCEYMALELPNVAYQTNGPTPMAAVGIVVNNPDPSETVTVQLTGADEQAIRLINEQTISNNSPDRNFSPVTVSSQIQDSNGMVVQANITDAVDLEIPPLGMGTFLLPRSVWPDEGTTIQSHAIRISSDRPIGAYQFSPYCCNFSFTNDASLLIPTTALGNNYRFLGVPTWAQTGILTIEGSPAAIAVTATKDFTELYITLPAEAQIEADTSGRLIQMNGAYAVRLDKQETLLIRSAVDTNNGNFLNIPPQPDLSGALISSSEPVSVFSSHACSFYPERLAACDHLEEQLFPIETWGNNFALVPTIPRAQAPFDGAEKTYWKILAQGEGARVTLSTPFSELNAVAPGFSGVPSCLDLVDPADPNTFIMGPRGFCEFGTKESVEITSDQGLMVMGIISGQESVPLVPQAGDPSIFLLPPARQFRQDYAFLAPGTYAKDYVALTFQDGIEIQLDGQPVDLSTATQITNSTYKVHYIELEDGAHQLAGTGPFGIMVFAFDDFVSYAFTGGLNLIKR